MELRDKPRDEHNYGFEEQDFTINNRKRETFWEGLKRLTKSYCEVSSIQGLNYMVKDGTSWFERIWWIIIFLLCVSGCSFMVYQLVDKWMTTPVLVTLATKETPIHEIPFPAVTICPETKISRQCVNYTETLRRRRAGEVMEVDFEENVSFDHMSLLCSADNHQSTIDLARKLMQDANISLPLLEDADSLKNLLKLDDYAEFLDECKSVSLDNAYCSWMGREEICNKILTPTLTDEGLCYSFNMFDVRDIYSDTNQMKYYKEGRRNPNWDPDYGYPDAILKNIFPRRAYLNGARNSLVVAILTKKSDIYYTCREFALQGIRVSLHMPSRIPRPSEVFFSVGLNQLTTVAVTPNLMYTTPSVKDYSPRDRNCYFGLERKLKYFKLYSQSNCNMECWTNYTIHYCGCVHFYMPRDANTSICDMDKRRCLVEARVSYPMTMLAERMAIEKGQKSDKHCDCLPFCSDLTYDTETSTGEWKFYEQTDDPEAQRYHASAVKIFFKNNYFLPTEKSELYGVVDFISNSGGVLGLFIGFSLFSLAEIIYFLTVRLIENQRRHGYWAGERTTE